MNAAEIRGLGGLDQELRRVEPMLVSAVSAGDPFLDQVATHLIQAGGKRLRPMLALASATRGVRAASREDLLGSVSVELVHLASLYHDDVIDEATIRRGTDSVNSRFGNLMAIVGGDYLLARAAEIAAGLGTEVAGLLATTLGRLCQGQVSEVKTVFSVERTTEQYLEAIAGKTAALMATSCRIGALTGHATRDEVEALTEYGRNFGMVFQLRDDILDVVATNGELGKPPGQDLAEGVYTLPVLHALADPEIGPELATLLGQPLALPERDKARAMVANSSGIDATISVGRQFAAKANDALAGVVSAELGAALRSLTGSLFDDLPG
ncbi:MAG TPA: polyprenyl synthetase family protein [Acidimicrobiales bacterium]|nr:polyprenyl synthetase family protein [Acidimicrobiales bacterium]